MTLAEMPAPPLADTPLGRMIATTATDIWNDSCAIDELEYALSFGAVGATANPTIVVDVWRKEPAYWRDRVTALAAARPDVSICRTADCQSGDNNATMASVVMICPALAWLVMRLAV